MFDKNKLELLDVAYQTFVARTHVFDVLRDDKWKDTGIENWVQTEFIIALVDREYDVSTIGKRERNCDIIVKSEKSGLNIGIEIETITYPEYCKYVFVEQGLRKHINPEPDLFFFLGRIDNNVLMELDEYIEQHGYVEKHKMFMKDWMVMLVKKN